MLIFRGFGGKCGKTSMALAALSGAALLVWPLLRPGLQTTALAQQPPASSITPAAAPAHPLDQPIAWLKEGKKYHNRLRDYECTLIKQERIKGQLQPEHIIAFKFRNLPFSVNMHWLAPSNFANQEVSFVHGWNNGKMRVHAPTGQLGAKVVGWISIDPRDPRVLEHSRHTIYEAGIGNLIDQTLQNMERERPLNKTKVDVGEYDYNKRRCIRMETTRTERIPNAQQYSYRSVLYIDKETKLPVRAENYDWPRQGGDPRGDLMEVFSFIDFRFNVGLTDAYFAR